MKVIILILKINIKENTKIILAKIKMKKTIMLIQIMLKVIIYTN
jgi:hypothetical protein